MAENRELALVLKLVADQFQSELKKSGGALGEFNRFISDWKTQLAAGGTALFAIAKSTANYGEELLKSSQKTGIAVEALAGLQHAANLADLESAQLTQGLKFLSVNMVEASRQTGDGEALFRRLGIAATTTTGQLRPTEEVLLDVAEAFAKSKDGAGKSETAVKLFGKAGLDLIPFLNQGKAGIRELMEEAKRLGLVMSKDDAEAANKFNDELKKLAAQARGMTFAVGKELIPVMTELIELFRSLGVGAGLSAGLQFLHERFIGLNVLLKELQANAQFLTGTGKDALSFEGLRAKIAQLEAEGKQKVLEFRNQGVLTSPGGSSGGASSGDKPELAQLADQEKLAKALVAIWQSNFRSIEDHNKRIREEAEGRLSLEFLAFDRQEQFRKEDEAYQESRGRLIVAQTSQEVRVRQEAVAKERDELAANSQAWINYYDELGGDTQNFYGHKMDLLRTQLAKELELNKQQAAELLLAWRNHDSARAEQIMADSPVSDVRKETVELNTMRQAIVNLQEADGDFFEGWAKGMRNYVRDTKSGFGLAADMARRTAQMMEQGFKTFFFDAMNGKINSLKDILKSLLDFAKNIVAQVGAQLLTNQLLGALPGANGRTGGAASFSKGVSFPKFAMGGVGNFGAGSMAVLHGREAVVPLPDGRSIPVTMSKQAGSPEVSVPITIQVVNQVQGASVSAQRETGGDGRQLVRIMVRQEMKAAFADGSMDSSQQRFGSNVKPFGR